MKLIESLAENLYPKQTEQFQVWQKYWSFSSVIEKCLKNAEFSGVLSPKVTLGATFNETRALTSVKYVAS